MLNVAFPPNASVTCGLESELFMFTQTLTYYLLLLEQILPLYRLLDHSLGDKDLAPILNHHK